MVVFKHFCLLLCVVFVATDPISTPIQSNYNPEELLKLGIINYLHPDAHLNVKEIILKYGYPLDVFTVISEGGYILEMHRIPHGLNNPNPDPNRPVVFLMHGLLCSSADWVITGPEKGLGFILADLGYDVWMGNARGNTWSRNNTDYDPDKYLTKFWDFSWHEIGVYDLPAMIDRVLEETGAEKIYYVGHSQGTTAFYVMTSEKPKYNDKIRIMVSLAPIAYMGNLPNIFFKILSYFDGIIGGIAKLIGADEFLPSSTLIQLLAKSLCEENSPVNGICSNILFLICGFNTKQLNETVVPIILTHTPAGASTKQILHYAQGVQSKQFKQFDYGFVKNLIKYGKTSPPKYDISKITAPVALFYASNDRLASTKDVNKLSHELPNMIFKYLIKDDEFNHLDFLWANEVVPLVYERVISVLSHY